MVAKTPEAAELELLKALLLEVLGRLIHYEPDAAALIDRIAAPELLGLNEPV